MKEKLDHSSCQPNKVLLIARYEANKNNFSHSLAVHDLYFASFFDKAFYSALVLYDRVHPDLPSLVTMLCNYERTRLSSKLTIRDNENNR